MARGASKTLSLHRLPQTLVLHLKRFTHGERGGVKLTKPLHFDASLRRAPVFFPWFSPFSGAPAGQPLIYLP